MTIATTIGSLWTNFVIISLLVSIDFKMYRLISSIIYNNCPKLKIYFVSKTYLLKSFGICSKVCSNVIGSNNKGCDGKIPCWFLSAGSLIIITSSSLA
jgi:hypothetical protein